MTDARTILLVEDNPSEVELTKRAFAQNAVDVSIVVANDGKEALELLLDVCGSGHACQKLPDLVLLDLKLPKIDGLEVLRRLRESEKTRRLPIVILSSSNEHRDVSAAYELGANSYIRKPVDYTQFSMMIGVLCKYWLEHNQSSDNYA
jgi:two-component system, response regulator